MHGKSNIAKMTDGLTIADTISTGLGRKFAKLLPQALTIQTQIPMASPFGRTFPGDKGAAAGAQRVSLDLRCTCPTTLAIFQEIDAWAVAELAKNSERIFGKKMSLEQVQAAYRPCLRRKEGFAPLLHTKMTLDAGPNATSFWDEQKQRRLPPDDFRNVSLLLKLSVPHLWLSAGTCGFVVNVTSYQIMPQVPEIEECPF